MLGFKVITQFEQGIVFRWGKVLPGTREPGLTWVNRFTDRLRKVNMQVVVAAVPAQEAITRDNVTLKVDPVMPVPVELLRFFDRMAPATSQAMPPAEDARGSSGQLPAPEVPALTVPSSRPASAVGHHDEER
jgi:hypothetical protein